MKSRVPAALAFGFALDERHVPAGQPQPARGRPPTGFACRFAAAALVVALCGGAVAAPTPAGRDSATAPATPAISTWVDRIKLSGILDGEFRLLQPGDLLVPGSSAISDLYVRQLDLGIEAAPRDWAQVTAVLNSEWIGDSRNRGDERARIDEVHFDLQAPHAPLYLVLGKRTQPFGLFESDLVSDPLTQDLYETKPIGLTLGFRGAHGLDASWTVYHGMQQMEQLLGSGAFDTTAVRRPPGTAARSVDSYILSVSLIPFEHHLTLLGALLSEPGTDRRNLTWNSGFDVVFPVPGNLVLAGDYMQALQRETYVGLARQVHERTLSVTASYLFARRAHRVHGNGNYRSRKSHLRFHPIEAAARYEFFADDGLSRLAPAWTLKSRASLGGRYTLFEDGKMLVYSGAEFRKSTYRGMGLMDDRNHELYLRLGLDF
jgi:hypothetical protein